MKILIKKLSYAIYIVLVAFLFTSCENNGSGNATSDYKTIQIEGCDYIIYDYYSGKVGFGYMAHKGNCKACSE